MARHKRTGRHISEKREEVKTLSPGGLLTSLGPQGTAQIEANVKGQPAIWTSDHKIMVPNTLELTHFVELNQRFLDQNIHGVLLKLDDAASVSSGVPFVTTAKGIGKVFIALIAGTDVVGNLTITGTSVDRDTGTQTGSDSEVLLINGTTTDNSDTDGTGGVITRHKFTKGYLSSKWWVGQLTLSTSTLNISDMDVYHISFEQFNDVPKIVLNTFDVNLLTTNANAEFHVYLYSVVPKATDLGPPVVSGSFCEITLEESLHLESGDALANQYWRIRKSNLDLHLDGRTSGIFMDMFFMPTNQTYFEDVTIKLWGVDFVPIDLGGVG